MRQIPNHKGIEKNKRPIKQANMAPKIESIKVEFQNPCKLENK